MGLLAVLKLKPLDVPESVTETERSGGGKGDKDKTPAPKVAQVAAEPEIEKTDGKSGGGSPGDDTAPEKTGGKDGESEPEKAKLSPAEVKAKSDYQKARAAIKKLIDDLNANAQRGTIMAQINQATAKLAEADAHAVKLEFPQANAALTATGVICAAARKLADDWGAYAKLRASCAAMVSAFKGFDDATVTASLNTTIAQADALVAATPPKFIAATAQLQGIDDVIRPKMKVKVDDNKAKLVALEALDPKVKTFLASELAKARSLVATLDSSFASGEWSVLLSAWAAVSDVMGPTARMAPRRQAYETQRTATVAAIDAVKADASVKGQAPALDALLAQADGLASHDTMNFNGGNKVLVDAETRAKATLAAAPTVASYNTERAAADKELAALAAHAAAAQVAPQLAAIRKLLQDATAAVGLAANNAQAWSTALTAVQRARADLAEAKKVADDLGASVAAQAAAANPNDVAGMKTALAKLRTDATAAAKLPFAAEAAAQFKSCTDAADKADKALAKNDGKAGAKALAEAAQALAAARSVQSGHGQYAMMLATVEAKLKALQALPTAASIKASFEPIVKALADAKAKDKAKAEVEALAALRRGNDAVAAAEQAHRDRSEFDNLATASLATINALGDAKAKKEHTKALDEAKKIADKLRFGDAKAALQAIEVKIDEAKLKSAAAANPGDPQILTIAKKMAANGGGKTLDALIKGQPDTADPRILTALAEGRYGMAFSVDPSADPKDEMKSMKTVCEMFSKIPQDIVGNTSITKVSHKDKTDKSVGGGYTPASGAIGMTGRPKITEQNRSSARPSRRPRTASRSASCRARSIPIASRRTRRRSTSSPSPRRTRSATASTTRRASWPRTAASRRSAAGSSTAPTCSRWPTSSARTSSSTPRPSRRNTCSRPCSASRPPRRRCRRRPATGPRRSRTSTTGSRSRATASRGGASRSATRSPSAAASTRRPTPATGSATMPRRATRVSPATSSARPANGSPSSTPAFAAASSARSTRPSSG